MKSFVLLALLYSSTIFAGFIPANKLNIPSSFQGGLTQEQFNKVIDQVYAVYSPVVSQKGATLEILRRWEDGTVNAYAARDSKNGKTWTVAMYGGLARHPLVTEDGFAVVVCHELGHHLGGAPKKTQAFQVDPKWASNEGEADYFATTKCLRKIFENDDNESVLAGKVIPKEVETACTKSFPNTRESSLCQRVALAGYEIAQFLNALGKSKKPVSFSTPDRSKVWKISNKHPEAQCRLDTYFQGALCRQSADVELGLKDPSLGACTLGNGDLVGIRPRCWMTKL